MSLRKWTGRRKGRCVIRIFLKFNHTWMTRHRERVDCGKLKSWLSYKKVRRKIASWCRFMESHQFSIPIEIPLINTMKTWLKGEQEEEEENEHSSNTLSRFSFSFVIRTEEMRERKTIVTNFMWIGIIRIAKMFSLA